ncbi:hypothetical protein AK830_g8346 [Neonectria ditissima]|uniref:ribonuclease H n=1 Tax=Neonectria ditissima TaxID=78410 RepID=A0A0P7BEF6_9HYPO|nr:hypothetical protein AK830_g8346 [Neonectria ditissima]
MGDNNIGTQFEAANKLLKTDGMEGVRNALKRFEKILQLDPRDSLGVRDIIPNLLLRLGQEQECYDFLRRWATVDSNMLPNRDVRKADAFESIDMFCSGNPSLSHLVALTLLKLRLYLDCEAYSTDEFDFDFSGPDPDIDRPVGRLVQAKVRNKRRFNAERTAATLKTQYSRLCQMVNDANPFLWEALVTDEACSPPAVYRPGSKEEADLVVHHCRQAWQESEDADVMIDADTWQYTRVYQRTFATAATTETLPINRGTGKVFPSVFKPPLATSLPSELFPATRTGGSHIARFICRNEPTKMLVYIDGACKNNGQPGAQAGWAVVWGNSDEESDAAVSQGVVCERLENQGPFGDDSVATSNRAELRAAIAALRFCDWRDDGYSGIVLASDSSYVVDGATGWTKGWVRNGWKTRIGAPVQNQDLWHLLLGEVERWKHRGLRVEVWKIPRELNSAADAAAKHAAFNMAAKVRFDDSIMSEPPERDHVNIRVVSSQFTTIEDTAESGLPRILMLCLESEDLFDACSGRLVSLITSKAKMERARTQEMALDMLNRDSCPSVILVVDGALTRQSKVWERVIDHLRGGATVILAGCFSSSVTTGQFNRFFAKLGLPWQRGSYGRETVTLRHNVSYVSYGPLPSQLPAAYSQKAVFANHVEKVDAWYTDGYSSNEAAVVFTKVGFGWLGYVGDVNFEEGSDMVVLAMCGLLD